MTTTTYVDANLHHDQVTGRAGTACLYLVNATPSHWHTKRQATVETATFGSEFVAVRIATDQINDLRYTLMYLGVPVRSKAICLVTTNLWLTALVFPPLPYPRNQLFLPIIESEKPLLQDIFNSTGKMEVKPCRHPEQVLAICKYLASLEAPTFLEGDTGELTARRKGSAELLPPKRSSILNPKGPRKDP